MTELNPLFDEPTESKYGVVYGCFGLIFVLTEIGVILTLDLVFCFKHLKGTNIRRLYTRRKSSVSPSQEVTLEPV